MLRLFNVILTTLSKFIKYANDGRHRTSRRNYNNLLELGILYNSFDFGIGNIDTEHNIGMSLVNIIFNLFFARKGMDHVGDCTDFVDGVEHINRFWSVRHTDRNAIAFLGTDGFQSSGDFVNLFNHLFVSNLGIEILQSNVVGPFT